MAIVEVINFIFSTLLIFFNVSMFHALQKYKKIRSKEEDLFLEKKIFTVICFTYYLFLCIFMILDICKNDRANIFYQIQEYIFNVYIILIYFINFFVSLEMFFTYKNPIHYYLIIFNRKSRKIYEIIYIIIALCFLGLNILDPLSEKKSLEIKEKDKKNYTTPFLLLDRWKWVILLGTNIASIVFNFRLHFLLSTFEFAKKDKLKAIIKKKLISNFCYLAYPFYNLLLVGMLREKEKTNYTENLLFIVIGSFLIFIILSIDTILDLIVLSTSKFSQYKLRKTLVGYFAFVFPNDFEETIDVLDSIKLPKRKLTGSDDDEDEEEEEEENNSENEAEISLLPKSPKDTELVSIFKNQIFIEDYFMSFCDQYFNILTASLFKIYNSKLFSIKSVENKKIKEEMGGISISGIGGIDASNTKDISATADETDNSSSYTFHTKKKNKNHFAAFKNIIGDPKEDLRVKITSYYTDNCVMNIKKCNLVSKKIASSFISHYIIAPKKEDKENPNNFWSLTSANAKEEYFKNMKNISFKSYDKNFNFDFFETDEQTISENNSSNKNIANMITQYFKYIEEGKGKTGTFLPELIGVFKVTIHNFKTMLIFISRNSIVNNVPKNFYTYWQLIRFDKLKPQKVATSKFRGQLLTEEPLFEKLYASDVKKNKDMNKVMLKNYSDFKEIVENDINFLRENNLINVNLLMMYFEYENTQKHEKQGAIKIRKTDANEAEIVNVDMPEEKKEKEKNKEEKEEKEEKKEEIKEEKKEELEKIEKEKQEKGDMKIENDDILQINGNDENDKAIIGGNFQDDLFKDEKGEDDMFGDEGFDFMPDVGKEAHNLVDYISKVNINGYEGNFDNFICMCFFTFENAFDLNNKFGSAPDEVFKNKILENFIQLKAKE